MQVGSGFVVMHDGVVDVQVGVALLEACHVIGQRLFSLGPVCLDLAGREASGLADTIFCPKVVNIADLNRELLGHE